MLTGDEAAASLGISRRTIDSWVLTGRLVPSEERGYYNAIQFTAEEVERARAQRASELVANLEQLGYVVELKRRE